MKDLLNFKRFVLGLIVEDWKGNRPIGTPSPPFRKGVGHMSTASHMSGIKKFWDGDRLKEKTKEYQNLTPEQKLSVLSYGSKKYDVFKTKGFKHYVKMDVLKSEYKNTSKVRWLNREIGKSEGVASKRQAKFDEAYKKFKRGETKTIDVLRSDGATENISPKTAEKWYRVSVLYPRYKATLLKKQLDRYRRK